VMKRFGKAEEGTQTIELALVILPLFAMLLLVVDVCWLIFAQASIQHAAREGVRFAVTGQLPAAFKHQDDAIKSVVQANSYGFVSDSSGTITIQYYDPTTLKPVNGAGSNSGGNMLQVTVSGVEINPFGPIMRSSTAVTLSASSADVMESAPGGVPAPR
jgi:Flp pilus assembly protein TadG